MTTRSIGWFGLAIAATGALCVALPSPGLFFAMAFGILGIGVGLVGYRRRAAPGAARLAGAGGVTVGLIAVGLGATKYALTLAALTRLENLF